MDGWTDLGKVWGALYGNVVAAQRVNRFGVMAFRDRTGMSRCAPVKVLEKQSWKMAIV